MATLQTIIVNRKPQRRRKAEVTQRKRKELTEKTRMTLGLNWETQFQVSLEVSYHFFGVIVSGKWKST